MSCVTAVEGEWLAEMGPMFFTIKESYKTRILQRQLEKDQKLQMQKEHEDYNMKQKSKEDLEKVRFKPNIKQVMVTPGYSGPGSQIPKKTSFRIGL